MPIIIILKTRKLMATKRRILEGNLSRRKHSKPNGFGKFFRTHSDWLKILEPFGVFGEPHEQVREARI